MSVLTPETADDTFDESRPPSLQHHRSKSASEEQSEEAKLVFNKTIDGHYRHGKTGYRQVGALFLTWKDDDMQCKETEVDKLRELFASKFNFKTEYYEIPSDRRETALHKKLADFCHDYDSPEDLAIIYYGGHAYEDKHTKEFKFAAKFENDGSGDPTASFSDIRNCLRLPSCDQLIILDCCWAAKAFAREHIGKRNFELITSVPHDRESPSPISESSFTTALHHALTNLIEDNPKGFSTSHLYREVYHTVPITSKAKPLLFDQALNSFGKIWLRPQLETLRPPKAKEEGRYLNLTFRLNDDPSPAVMNELAVQLQYLSHVDQIRFENLKAPKQQITDLMQYIIRANKLRPLIKRLHARRQLRRLAEMNPKGNNFEASKSLIKQSLRQIHPSAYDWSSTSEDVDHSLKRSEHSRNQRKKSGTWPPNQGQSSTGTLLSNFQVSPPGILVPMSVPHHPQEQADGTMPPTSRSRNRRGGDDAYDAAGTVARAETGSLHKVEETCFRQRKHSELGLIGLAVLGLGLWLRL